MIDVYIPAEPVLLTLHGSIVFRRARGIWKLPWRAIRAPFIAFVRVFVLGAIPPFRAIDT